MAYNSTNAGKIITYGNLYEFHEKLKDEFASPYTAGDDYIDIDATAHTIALKSDEFATKDGGRLVYSVIEADDNVETQNFASLLLSTINYQL